MYIIVFQYLWNDVEFNYTLIINAANENKAIMLNEYYA